ncbi:hypothetical protein M6B38_124175 [Iris pallida]|uniref:Uncharacterized protein n=1 Tax=Iris pallida TaxID=29817 RepID=A0AAX6H2U2_IRIPA|nr:hypothetical protein M6B38_124175 [Iris pallida]
MTRIFSGSRPAFQSRVAMEMMMMTAFDKVFRRLAAAALLLPSATLSGTPLLCGSDDVLTISTNWEPPAAYGCTS